MRSASSTGTYSQRSSPSSAATPAGSNVCCESFVICIRILLVSSSDSTANQHTTAGGQQTSTIGTGEHANDVSWRSYIDFVRLHLYVCITTTPAAAIGSCTTQSQCRPCYAFAAGCYSCLASSGSKSAAPCCSPTWKIRARCRLTLPRTVATSTVASTVHGSSAM